MLNDPVYIFSGALDDVVYPVKQEAQSSFYNNYSADVEYVSKADLGHVVSSIFNGETYDLAGDMFTHLLFNVDTNPISTLNAADENW